MEKYLEYFNELVHENEEDIITICESAADKIYQNTGIRFDKESAGMTKEEKSKERIDQAKLVGVMFAKTYDAIIKSLKELETTNTSEKINFCDRFEIGFSTSEDEDDEKQGNFMIFMNDLGKTHKDISLDEDPDQKQRAVYWNMENMKENPEVVTNMCMKARELLDKDLDIKLQTHEFISPFFSLVYDAIINYIKIRRREIDEFEFEIYFMACFTIGARESEDGDDIIYITPNIDSKLSLKDDVKATSKHE